MMTNFSLPEDLTDIPSLLQGARQLAITAQNDFIDVQHLYISILTVDSMASPYCESINPDKWIKTLPQLYPRNKIVHEDSSLPLTKSAELVIRHAFTIADSHGSSSKNSIHLLLALLSLESEITEEFSRKGYTFETVAEIYFGKPVKRTVPAIEIARLTPYTNWNKSFMSGRKKIHAINTAFSDAILLSSYCLYEESIAACKAGLSLTPEDATLQTLLFNCYIWKRDWQTALPLGRQLFKSYPESFEFQFALSVIYDELNMYEEAWKVFETLLTPYAGDATLYNNIGFHLYRQGKYNEAIPYYEKAISIDPDFAYPYDNLGFVLYKTGQTEKALELIDKALLLDKGNSYAYKYKGVIFLEQGNKQEAKRNLELALKFRFTIKYGDEVDELLRVINNT